MIKAGIFDELMVHLKHLSRDKQLPMRKILKATEAFMFDKLSVDEEEEHLMELAVKASDPVKLIRELVSQTREYAKSSGINGCKTH